MTRNVIQASFYVTRFARPHYEWGTYECRLRRAALSSLREIWHSQTNGAHANDKFICFFADKGYNLFKSLLLSFL